MIEEIKPNPNELVSESETDTQTSRQRKKKGECTVCLLLIKAEVKMCPHCNALYCQTCIDNLPSSRCPMCGQYQPKDSYVRNRPLEEIIKEIRQAKHLTCHLHDMDKSVYCEDC